MKTFTRKGVLVRHLHNLKSFVFLLVSGFLLFAAGQSWAANSYVWVKDPINHYEESASNPVSYYGTNTDAYAFAGTGTLRARATGQQTVPSTFSYGDGGRIQSAFHNEIYIGPGSSGLSIGTPITLNLSLSLDGQLFTSVYSPAGGYVNNDGGSANAAAKLLESSYYTVHDVSPSGYSLAVDFQPKADMQMDGSYIGNDWEYVITGKSWSWSLNNNLGDSLGDALTFDPYNRPVYNCTDCTEVQNQTLFFDTGQLNIDFETAVGNTLYLNGLLDVYASVGNGGSDGVLATADSDFFNTFGFDITDSQGTGVDLNYDLPAPTPIPGAVWLFGSGLISLLGIRRKFRN